MAKSNSGAHLNVYSVREFESASGQKKSWTKVGVAFPHKDTPGFNVELHALPLDGHLVALLPSEDERSASGGPG
jgi:hypothetical protein